MNDTFSFTRFGLLLKKFIKEHKHTYLLYATSLFGILFLMYGLAVLSSLNGRFRVDTPILLFLLGSIFCGGLFSASFYNFFQNKAKGIQFINLPSSHSEKLTLGFIFTQIVFFTTFLVIFFVIDHVMCGFYNRFHKIPSYITPEFYSQFVAEPVDFSNATIKGAIILALVISSISHFGSLVFEKHAFAKTALFMVIFGAALMYFNFYSLKAMIPEETMPGGQFYNESLRVGTDEMIKGVVFLPKSWDTFMYWFLPAMLYILFWAGSYFKLKEKQV